MGSFKNTVLSMVAATLFGSGFATTAIVATVGVGAVAALSTTAVHRTNAAFDARNGVYTVNTKTTATIDIYHNSKKTPYKYIVKNLTVVAGEQLIALPAPKVKGLTLNDGWEFHNDWRDGGSVYAKNTKNGVIGQIDYDGDAGSIKKDIVVNAAKISYPYVVNGYLAVAKKGYTIWTSMSLNKKSSSTSGLMNHTYYIPRSFYKNGKKYYQVNDWDNYNKSYGYVNANALNRDNVYDHPIATKKYATLTNKNAVITSNYKTGAVKHYAKNYFQKTYTVKTMYQVNQISHFIYSLYDAKGKWFGYINYSDVKISSGAQGVALPFNKKLTVKKSGYNIWTSFSFNKKTTTTTKYKGKKLTAKYVYNHASGAKYYSVYSGSKWLGYVNSSALK